MMSPELVSNIRRRLRERHERQNSIFPVLDQLLATIRKAELATVERI